MLNELKKFYDTIEENRVEVLSKDVDAIVAEKLALVAEKIRAEAVNEITAELAVLEIKKQTIAEAIEVLEKVVETQTQMEDVVELDEALQGESTDTN